MDYVLDPELAAAAAAIPKIDLSDLASAREAERLVVDHLPPYEAQMPLFVQDVTVTHSAADVPARVYAPAKRFLPHVYGVLTAHRRRSHTGAQF